MPITREDIEKAEQEAKAAFESRSPWEQEASLRWMENLRRIDREMTERRVPFITL